MANAKLTINDLPNELTSLEGGDLLAVWDTSGNTTAKVNAANVVSSLVAPAVTGEATLRINADANLQDQVDLKAPLAGPDFTGAPTAPTAAPGTNDGTLANTAFVTAAVDAASGAVISVAGKTGAVSLVAADVGLGAFAGLTPATLPLSTAETGALATKEPNIAAGTSGQYWRGDKTFQTLDKAAVGLANVDNTADISKPISTATQTALDLKMNLLQTDAGPDYNTYRTIYDVVKVNVGNYPIAGEVGRNTLGSTQALVGAVDVPAPVVRSITSLTSVGTTATATTSAPHGYPVGLLVTIAGATPSAYNTTALIVSTPTSSSFTYVFAGGTSPATLSSATATNANASHSSGVGAYARSSSTTQFGVGIFSSGLVTVDGSAGWAGNGVVANTPLPGGLYGNESQNTGVAASLWNYEGDVAVMKTSGGLAPGGNCIGIEMVGNSQAQPSGGFKAFSARSPGLYESPPIKWKQAYWTEDGSAEIALDVGCAGIGNGVSSQPINLRSRKADGTNFTGLATLDSTGNFVIIPGSQGGVVLSDSAGTTRLFTSTTGSSVSGRLNVTSPAGGTSNINDFIATDSNESAAIRLTGRQSTTASVWSVVSTGANIAGPQLRFVNSATPAATPTFIMDQSGSLTIANNISVPAGGTTALGLKMSTTANLGVFFGSGAPSLSAAKGSLYLRTDGTTTNNRMYVNTDGSTTWTAVTTVA